MVEAAGGTADGGVSMWSVPDRVVAGAALFGSAVALAAAPAALTDSYSWIEHTTSESGAQGVQGAWVARTGFLLFGLSVVRIARLRRPLWGQSATALHLVFATCMMAVAAYSARSWIPTAAFDSTEDLLHSIFATLMGFAFAFGVAAVALERRRDDGSWRFLDVAAVTASVVLPLGMSIDGSVDGVLQRVMFAIAYLWFVREAFRP